MKAIDQIDQIVEGLRPRIDGSWSRSEEAKSVLDRAVKSAERGTSLRGKAGEWVRAHRLRVGVAATALAVVCAVGVVVSRPPATDVYRADALGFFERNFAFGAGGNEFENYPSLEATAAAADAVVVATVEDVVTTRVIQTDGDDRVYMVGIKIKPIEVVRGALPDEFKEQLIVEFTLGGTAVDVANMKPALPEGQMLWFLRSKGADADRTLERAEKENLPISKLSRSIMEAERPYYRLTSSQGLFAQGDGHVVDPVWNDRPRPDSVVEEAKQFGKVSELIAVLKSQS